ncbi:MAG: hypothetical protein WC858_00540 [Parcubacteria group bacterium]|jgi:hypothetical protein
MEGYGGKISQKIARIWNRVIVRSNYDVLYDELRSLEFFCILFVVGAFGFLFAQCEFASVLEKDQFLVFLEAIFFLLQAVMALFLKAASKKAILRLKKDFEFINSGFARMIILTRYERAGAQFRRMLRKIFPGQLRGI